MTSVAADIKAFVEKLFSAGAHYGYAKARRHPSAQKFVFGAKNGVDIFDLERTVDALTDAENFAKKLAGLGKQLLFVGSKFEVRTAVRSAAASVAQPFVASRWVGGTLSNFALIRKRVEKLISLEDARETGQLAKYTKKERLLIDREIKRLEETFGGLRSMKSLPGALFVIDPRHEHNAVKEANDLGIPVIALANTDCDMGSVAHALPGNDANVSSVTFFIGRITDAYREGAKSAPAIPAVSEKPRTDAPAQRAPRRPSTR